MNRSQSPFASLDPACAAQGLPAHPAGRAPAETTRAPPSTATRAVASFEVVVDHDDLVNGDVPARAGRRDSGGRSISSSRAGMTTDTRWAWVGTGASVRPLGFSRRTNGNDRARKQPEKHNERAITRRAVTMGR